MENKRWGSFRNSGKINLLFHPQINHWRVWKTEKEGEREKERERERERERDRKERERGAPPAKTIGLTVGLVLGGRVGDIVVNGRAGGEERLGCTVKSKACSSLCPRTVLSCYLRHPWPRSPRRRGLLDERSGHVGMTRVASRFSFKIRSS